MTDQQIVHTPSDEISLKELIQKVSEWFAYLKTQWWKIAIAGIIGGAIGFVYAWMQPITYTAKTTFVVEDAKTGGGLSGLASLAGQFGVDVGGSGGGFLSGDNILFYFKSENLIREVLLSPISNADSSQSIADRYVNVYGLKDIWIKNKSLGQIRFPTDRKSNLTRLQDSLLQKISQFILADKISVSKIDKKSSFVQLVVKMEDELLAKSFCERVIEKAINNYLDIKTRRAGKTVEVLQKRVDSISMILNQKTVYAATIATKTATMDINPLYKVDNSVDAEKTTRDKSLLSAMFGEVVKNLELAKFTLSQETPVIQLIDTPRFPLIRNKESRLKNAVYFSLVAVFMVCALIIMSSSIPSKVK